ncbi:MAG: TonB family protein [Bacteroidetes bacterium]|nr:TonB family protein [Bacteroidota bacterium]
MTTTKKPSILGLATASTFALILLFAFSVMARPSIIKPKSVKQKKDTISTPFEQDAEFPGGFKELKKFICNNFKYPKEAIDHNVKGNLKGYFTVNRDGTVKDLKIYKTVGYGCDGELRRIIENLPLWKPRIIYHKAVNSEYFAFNVNFSCQSTKLEVSDIHIDAEFPLPPVEQYPEFKGGSEMLLKYLKDSTRYSAETQKSGLHGTVYIQIIVTKTGKITKTRILRGIGSPCDEEAIRVVSTMPDWVPGIQMGQPVDLMFQLAVKFETPK